MTDDERAQIDDLMEWLDNNADGADDAGALAHSCTRWFPALAALRADLAEMTKQRDLDVAQYRIEGR